MKRITKTVAIIIISYLAICAFFYWFNRGFYEPGDPAQEKFIQFIDPLGSYMRKRRSERMFA